MDREQQRSELYKGIRQIANDLRGAVDGWDFKNYVLGMLFYRYISENMTGYINKGEHEAGNTDFDYAEMSDEDAKEVREWLIEEKGGFILPSELFCNVRKNASNNENLNSFDQFENDKLLTDRQMQDFQSRYLDLYRKYRRKTDKADIEDDVIFEIELIKQIEVNIDYILNLVQKYHNDNCLDDEATANILKAVDSSVQLRSKKELIAAFLARVNLMPSDEDKKVTDEWQSFVKEKYDDEVSQLIADEKLKEDKTRSLLDKSFNQGKLKTGGTAIDECMPPMSRFGGGRAKKKLRIIDKFKTLFEKFSGIM